MATALMRIGVWVGLTILAFAVYAVSGAADNSAAVRVLVEHAKKLEHLDRPKRERVARRIIEGTALACAAILGAILTGVAMLIWATQ